MHSLQLGPTGTHCNRRCSGVYDSFGGRLSCSVRELANGCCTAGWGPVYTDSTRQHRSELLYIAHTSISHNGNGTLVGGWRGRRGRGHRGQGTTHSFIVLYCTTVIVKVGRLPAFTVLSGPPYLFSFLASAFSTACLSSSWTTLLR